MLKFKGRTAKPEKDIKPAKVHKKAATSKKDEPFLLTPFGFFLSGCSVIWTTFSIVDLIGIGAIGLTVAVSLDVIWVAIMYAVHKDIPFYGKVRTTQVIGWVFLLAVVALLVWHGVSLEGKEILGYQVDQDMSRGMAIAGPLLPIGGKVVWVLVSSAYKKAEAEAQNPEGYTDEQREQLEDLERQSKFEEAEAEKALEALRRQHRLELEEIRMDAEKGRTRDQVNFENYLARAKQEQKILNETPVDLARVIQGKVERSIPAQPQVPALPRSVPAKSTPRRSEITVPVTDLNETQRKNMALAAEYLLLQEKDPSYSQNAFARDKGITGGYLSKLLKTYREAVANGALDEEEIEKGA